MNNYYITGLPRSGSTLLLNILKQNPALSDISKGRQWGTDKSLPDLFRMNNPKILVTYRPILEVLASFVKLAEKYPIVNFIDASMMANKDFAALSYRPLNDARCDWLMRFDGPIENSNSLFKNMIVYQDWFHLITYDDLCSRPKEIIAKIYDFLEIDYFEHDLQNIPQHNEGQDEQEYGIPTLHTIRTNISKAETDPEKILSDYVIQKYANALDFFTKGWLQSQT